MGNYILLLTSILFAHISPVKDNLPELYHKSYSKAIKNKRHVAGSNISASLKKIFWYFENHGIIHPVLF